MTKKTSNQFKITYNYSLANQDLATVLKDNLLRFIKSNYNQDNIDEIHQKSACNHSILCYNEKDDAFKKGEHHD